MSPEFPVVRVLVGGISEIGHHSAQVVLAQGSHSERGEVIEVFPAEGHYVVYVEIEDFDLSSIVIIGMVPVMQRYIVAHSA